MPLDIIVLKNKREDNRKQKIEHEGRSKSF
jgi:hypothetical protein